MYFVLKSLKIYLHYSALHVSDTIVSIMRSFSVAHAVSGPVHLVGVFIQVITTMYRTMNLKFINAKQAREVYKYKNTKQKLYRTIAAIWYNKSHVFL